MPAGGRAPSLLVALARVCLVLPEFKLQEGRGLSCRLYPLFYAQSVVPDAERTLHQ